MKNILLFFLFIFTSLLFCQTSTLPTGSGTVGSPYLIANLNNLYWIVQPGTVNGLTQAQRWTKYYKQTANIDASATSTWNSNGSGGFYGWIPIGNITDKFSGNYNGQGYTISGIYVNRPGEEYIGFFGWNGSGTISNLGVINCYVNGVHGTGGLAGVNQSTVSKCFSTGTVNGVSQYAGGLIGTNTSNVSQSYSTCNVTGPNGTYGGLIGQNTGPVSNCYARGNVVGGSDNASFISRNSNTISYSYSTGAVNITTTNGFGGQASFGTTIANFFDQTTTTQTSGYGATAKTTAEMKTYSTFTDAGWNITIWNLDAAINDGYPYLKWQNPGGSPLPVELKSFSAGIVKDNNVELLWQTATEMDNYGFEIERCKAQLDGIDIWLKIGFIEGSNVSNSPKNYQFNDNNVAPGVYFYRLKQVDNTGKYEYSQQVQVDLSVKPANFSLKQNFPNPFNPSTTIVYTVSLEQNVSLKIYDMLGNEITTLVNEVKQPGTYDLVYDASLLSSGMYIYKLQSGSFSESKKFVLMK